MADKCAQLPSEGPPGLWSRQGEGCELLLAALHGERGLGSAKAASLRSTLENEGVKAGI